MGKNPQLEALNKVGQSVWYDNVSREVLRTGELKSIIDSGVSGLTSNPSIFKKAIADSSEYDKEISSFAKQGLNAEQICEELMVGDIAQAADLLLPVFKASSGADGHCSIEVSPNLARDTGGSLEAARRLWSKLKRPNIMVKIPGTKEGIPAIKAALEDGININVTLLFSDSAYRQVAEAYIAALETRVKAGKSVKDIASVASFFVSRVDAICEKKFDELVKAGRATASDKAKFEGKIGIANSRVAYASFLEMFGGERWKKLAAQGARVQRPLWASTGTKNPAYSPVLYVEELAGPDTVNTMPPATLKALMEGAKISNRLFVPRVESEAMEKTVKQLGLPFESLLVDLEVDGVKIFADAYQELLAAIEAKRAKLA